jgi:hypothetical protein
LIRATMDSGEYWLLNSVVEGWYPVRWLVSEDTEGSFNKRNHGLDRHELIDVLEYLFRRGDLLAKRMYLLGVSPVPGSKHWDVLEPWQATYWKVLPLGHRMRFSYDVPPPEPGFDPTAWAWLKEIQNWYTPFSGS